jgi:trimethylamine:corrinoid methyltransferase-like protein
LEPINFTRLPRDSWQQKDIGDLIARADAHCKNLLTNAKPADLPEDVSRDLDSIVKEADAKLK